MSALILSIAAWCVASNEYQTTVDACKQRILRCVVQQKTEMEKQWCFFEPTEKPWPIFASEKEVTR